jgi:hypothetical protein
MIGLLAMPALTLPMAALAQSSSTRPSARNVPDAMSAPAPRGNVPSIRPYTQQEWDEMMDFLRVNSPLRAQSLANMRLPDNAPAKTNLIRTYRAYKLISEQNPEIGNLRRQQFQVEDKLFGLQARVRRFPEQADQLKPQVHFWVEKIVNLEIAEKEIRVKRLQSMLGEETAKLDQQKANAEATVEDRTDRIMEQARRQAAARGNGPMAAPATRPQQ